MHVSNLGLFFSLHIKYNTVLASTQYKITNTWTRIDFWAWFFSFVFAKMMLIFVNGEKSWATSYFYVQNLFTSIDIGLKNIYKEVPIVERNTCDKTLKSWIYIK